ncbi:MAG: large conductance mechanosensitive channel protein MscL [Actinomycetota bacterium]
MRQLLTEFRKFVMKGNLLEIAIAFILGLYFKDVIDVFTNGIVLNLVAAIVGEPTFDSITLDAGDSELLVGSFLNAVINLLLVGCVLFLIVKAYDTAVQRLRREEPDAVEPLTREGELLQEIRDLLRDRAS